MSDCVKYIIVRGLGTRAEAFCGFNRGCIIVSDSSLRDAKLFTNEVNAKEIAYKLNDRRYGNGGWYVREYYPWKIGKEDKKC